MKRLFTIAMTFILSYGVTVKPGCSILPCTNCAANFGLREDAEKASCSGNVIPGYGGTVGYVKNLTANVITKHALLKQGFYRLIEVLGN